MKRIYTAVIGASIYFLTLPTFVAAQSAGLGDSKENDNWFISLLNSLFGGLFGRGNGNGGTNGSLNNEIGGVTPASVPEIDASTGALALAALGAALLLVWEINRRRKAP